VLQQLKLASTAIARNADGAAGGGAIMMHNKKMALHTRWIGFAVITWFN
jgi:hypothetical protein